MWSACTALDCVAASEHAGREAGRARFREGVYADGWSGHARVDLVTALKSCEVCV